MSKTDELRRRAEEEVQRAKEKGHIPVSVAELVHELRVYQIELEMQNEELRQSQEEISKLYNQYHELYNNAPVGYISLDTNGLIININSKGTELLKLDKNRILRRGFSRFIPKDYQDKYYKTLANADKAGKTQEVELQLKRDKTLFNVQMEIMPLHDNDDEKYRIIVTDTTRRKAAEKTVED